MATVVALGISLNADAFAETNASLMDAGFGQGTQSRAGATKNNAPKRLKQSTAIAGIEQGEWKAEFTLRGEVCENDAPTRIMLDGCVTVEEESLSTLDGIRFLYFLRI